MTRTSGARNIVAFEGRDEIATTESQDIKHLANASNQSPLEQFLATLSHQRNYLSWIATRHQDLTAAREQLGERAPKPATYRKYRWYSEQLLLLEAINAFETFYKTTMVRLGREIRRYVPPSRIKGSVEARVLWNISGATSIPALIFEHQLFHDLDTIDEATQMLVNAKRYKSSNANASAAHLALLRALRCTFQIRHTLSHNQGMVTNSDSVKFKVAGFKAAGAAIIDPTKDALGESVRRFLEQEANQFTVWLIDKTAEYLATPIAANGAPLPMRLKDKIVAAIGSTPRLEALPWV
ncbi:hypothetical protein [Burkholderia cenocepacia]|uniref:hypothetical protein n=1 Tax=Burkholderia cenocepacia TaxID=95486 RepID=UPI002938DAD6|nr:hypothetical protein [Burkholderia cenocepacia]MDV3100567.1 hypothetical protein [Burkholderia cenocepacia]